MTKTPQVSWVQKNWFLCPLQADTHGCGKFNDSSAHQEPDLLTRAVNHSFSVCGDGSLKGTAAHITIKCWRLLFGEQSDSTQTLLMNVSGTSEPPYIYSLSVSVSSEVCVSGWMLACRPLRTLWLWLTVDQWSLIDSPNDLLFDWFTCCRFLESYFMKVIRWWTSTLNSLFLTSVFEPVCFHSKSQYWSTQLI